MLIGCASPAEFTQQYWAPSVKMTKTECHRSLRWKFYFMDIVPTVAEISNVPWRFTTVHRELLCYGTWNSTIAVPRMIRILMRHLVIAPYATTHHQYTRVSCIKMAFCLTSVCQNDTCTQFLACQDAQRFLLDAP